MPQPSFMKKTAIYLLLGTNLGDRPAQLVLARDRIGQSVGKVLRVSPVYESDPWGFESDLAFLNQALEVETTRTPSEVLKEILEIEKTMGRLRRGDRYTSRTIDIDILLFGELRITHPDLVVPHPRLPERRFALTPLYDLVPDTVHPVLNLTVAEMLDRCDDHGVVRPFRP